MIVLTEEQRYKLENLWFIYGNNGKRHTLSNHKFIQNILKNGEDARNFYYPDEDLIKLVDEIIKGG